MKWKQDQKAERTVRRFLFFPKCLKGEWRWLQFASWKQSWYQTEDGCGRYDREWVDEKGTDERTTG